VIADDLDTSFNNIPGLLEALKNPYHPSKKGFQSFFIKLLRLLENSRNSLTLRIFFMARFSSTFQHFHLQDKMISQAT